MNPPNNATTRAYLALEDGSVTVFFNADGTPEFRNAQGETITRDQAREIAGLA